MHLHAVGIVCLALVSLARAFPSGARSNASNPMETFSSHCTSGNFRPSHGNILAQSTPPPFTISVSSPSGILYQFGKPVTVTIESNKTSTTTNFKGFFIQGDSTEASFAGDIVCPDLGQKVSYCGKPGATHVNSQVKSKVVCTWNPPDYQIGRVQFVATIVSNFTTFWTGVKSSITLLADPSLITYQDKSQQLKEQVLRQIQSSAASFGNIMRQQQTGENAFSQFFNTG